jgi:hypothetical protein
MVKVGTETFKVTATVLAGEERDMLHAQQAKLMPGFIEYQAKVTCQIPGIALKRKN